MKGKLLLPLVVLGTALAATAQPVPKLNSIAPEWIQRGATIDVTLTGENLSDVTRFIFDGDAGLSATNVPAAPAPKIAVAIESSLGGIARGDAAPAQDPKRLTVRVTADTNATLTGRELRVVTPRGVSNPVLINVGQLSELSENEPNNALDQAQKISLPATVNGAIHAATEVDSFRFSATKGAEIILDVDAARRGSGLDSSLAVLDANGKELARSEDARGLDSFLAFRVPEDGDYIAQLRDFRYQGAGNYTYRLHVGVIPSIERVFPFGGQRGKSVEIGLVGHNLDGVDKLTLNIASTAPLGRQELRATTPRGLSNPFLFEASDLPDFAEKEPNDAIDQADKPAFPIAINGRIGQPGDMDRFKIRTDKDQKIVCEVAAARFGSKLDPLLILTDDRGNILQQNDDASGLDARIEFDAKKDTEYVVSVRDLTERGGEAFGYRLAMRSPSGGGGASFAARLLPDAIRVSRDGVARVRYEITRNNFDGPIRFAFEELPSGIWAEPVILSGGPTGTLAVIRALKDAPLGTFPVKLVATAMIDGKLVTRTAEALSGDRATRQAYLTVTEPAPFQLEVTTLSLATDQNQATSLQVTAQRSSGFTGEIKLAADGYAAGRDPFSKNFSGGDTTIKAGETTARIAFTPRLDSETGTRTIVVRGEATHDGTTWTQYSGPIPVTVSPVPFVISSTLPRLNLTSLPPGSTSAAGEAATTIKVDRRAGFTNELALALEGLPAGVNAVLDKIPANANETTLKLTASDTIKFATNATLVVTGAAMHNDRNYRHRTGNIALTIALSEPEPQTASVSTNAAVAK